MRLADEGWSALDIAARTGTTPRTWKYSFRVGARDVLRRRLDAQFVEQQREEADQATMGALIVVKADALRAATREHFPRTTSARVKTTMSDLDGFRQGQVAGQGINLAHQIDA